MIQPKAETPATEPVAGRPVASGDQWLGRNASDKRRLWERLNPRHRKQLRLLARALLLRQEKPRLSEAARTRLANLLDEFENLTRRIEQLLATVANRTPPTA